MKRVATANSPKGEPTASQSAMFANSFDSIFRAGGKEPAAMPDKGANGCLIETNQQNH
jgi:hypothetical protein